MTTWNTRKRLRHASWLLLILFGLVPHLLPAFDAPEQSGVGGMSFRHPDMDINMAFRTPAELPGQAGMRAANRLAALGVLAGHGRVDVRGGRWVSIVTAEPLVPGRGVGNTLSWPGLGLAPASDAAFRAVAGQAFRGYIDANAAQLQIETRELAGTGRVTLHQAGAVVQIHIPRVVDGIPVRGSYLTGVINHGNLVLLGTSTWGDVELSKIPGISEDAARAAVQAYVTPVSIAAWGKTEQVIVPMARGRNLEQIAVGRGYTHRLAWVIRPGFKGDLGSYEALVDAHSGELISFEDTNQYAEVKGGVLPVTNDGIAPDGVEQAGWPMPFADVDAETTDTGGNFTNTGTVTTDFFGPYVNINDQCGASSLTGSGVLDWGTSVGTDCATPGFGGGGNTHASRTGFYELNKIIEMARGQLPSNTWLQSQLTSNVNIIGSCNAFWNGTTLNFYRSGGGCSNTGEIAGFVDHEWGHGLDQNDATPGRASPSGEGIADIYMALRLNDSCVGRGFLATTCSGNGDPCLPPCTGVRDIDYEKRQSGLPHDYNWSINNCGGSPFCVGGVYSEAVWSLWKRKLQVPPYNYDDNTSHEIVTRLTFIGAGNTGTWFSGGPPYGGCAATSGYMNYLAADDDNGNLNDGTPHMQAIFRAFDDQEIACATPTVQDSGCAGTPTIAPVVIATPSDKSVSLSWGAVAGATEYEVFRTEGVFACDFGKVKLGATPGTSWNDSGLQNGRDYSYVVIPKGSAAACFGPASSCTTIQPLADPDLGVGPPVLAINTGDADSFIDNCEAATITFNVSNTGGGSLTNVRITGVTAISHPATTITTTTFPAAVSPSTLSEGATGSASFDFTAAGLAFGDALVFEVSMTSDEIAPMVKMQSLSITDAESDPLAVASKTWDFETDLDGWTLIQGTFDQSTTGGGAGSSAGYVASSTLLNSQCDQVRSPAFRLTATSTMTLQNNYEIENFSGGSWWDRANIALFESGVRHSVDPDGAG